MYNYMQVILSQAIILPLTRGAVRGGYFIFFKTPHPFLFLFFVSIVKIFEQIELSGIYFLFEF